MTKLRECPFCGREEIVVQKGGRQVLCITCGAEGPDYCSSGKEFILEAWNRRTPAPMTSVIEWTRYDGTPETLPDKNTDVLMRQTRGNFAWQCFYGRLQDDLEEPSETGLFWDLLRKGCIATHIGDEWAYLPEPPEGVTCN